MEWLTPEVLSGILAVLSTLFAVVFGNKFLRYKKLLRTVAEAFGDDGRIDTMEAQDILLQIKALYSDETK